MPSTSAANYLVFFMIFPWLINTKVRFLYLLAMGKSCVFE